MNISLNYFLIEIFEMRQTLMIKIVIKYYYSDN
jgi:hypothetical protein